MAVKRATDTVGTYRITSWPIGGRVGSSRLIGPMVLLLVAACAAPDPGASPDATQETVELDASPPDSGDEAPAATDQPRPESPDATTREDDGASASGPVASGQAEHLDVDGRRLDGGRLDLGELIGQPVALWMWTPW